MASLSEKMASGDSSGIGWTGEGQNFVDQLTALGLRSHLDVETEYDISVGKGSSAYGGFRFHHYIVLESPLLPIQSNRLIFELVKETDATGRQMVTPKVRIFSGDRNPDYNFTIKTTLRYRRRGKIRFVSRSQTLFSRRGVIAFSMGAYTESDNALARKQGLATRD